MGNVSNSRDKSSVAWKLENFERDQDHLSQISLFYQIKKKLILLLLVVVVLFIVAVAALLLLLLFLFEIGLLVKSDTINLKNQDQSLGMCVIPGC